ncbi:MAG: YhfC family intramembrane metalloprotease [Chloroflexia bacterium]|nr:YhfC family intramembrane metalloprotease [Chloroflexia bacterium]
MDTRMILAFLLAIAIEILFPLLLAFWLNRRLGTPWRLFGYGCLVFLIFQLLSRVPAMQIGQFMLRDRLQADEGLMTLWIVLAALSAALFEEGGRYLGYRWFWKKDPKTWANSLMYGAGHGGLESMLLVGGLALLSLMGNLALTQVDPALLQGDQAEAMRQAQQLLADTAWWVPLLGALERLSAMAVQVSLSVLVLQVFTRQRFCWWWLALGYHTLVDLSVLLQGRISDLQLELLLLVPALFSLGLIYWLRPFSPRLRPRPPA